MQHQEHVIPWLIQLFFIHSVVLTKPTAAGTKKAPLETG